MLISDSVPAEFLPPSAMAGRQVAGTLSVSLQRVVVRLAGPNAKPALIAMRYAANAITRFPAGVRSPSSALAAGRSVWPGALLGMALHFAVNPSERIDGETIPRRVLRHVEQHGNGTLVTTPRGEVVLG